eukprot:CAMPEP_0172611286 /NCGR_PEP_ID=MMETSP1068-20121228/30991_1 /TAXON_ID=35684 /ORGANISM="Pseudopedinella elastica, Strain CCMP716" /LENGTH=111 /DNA_ID=CAMNT_0013415217 /DNA_START=105 /DNA_END=440 /DNA_ORIENTATION=+
MLRTAIKRMVQDMPPPGGYPQIQYAARPTPRGPSGAVIWGASILCVSVGFYRVGQTNIERRAERAEVREARYAIAPLLQAEEDLRYVEARNKGLVPPNVYKTPNMWFPPNK